MIQTYRIIGAALAIPNVPGTWHAGQEVDVDTDSNEVLTTRLLPTTPHDADSPTEEPSVQPSTEHLKPLKHSIVAVKEATDIIDERNVE